MSLRFFQLLITLITTLGLVSGSRKLALPFGISAQFTEDGKPEILPTLEFLTRKQRRELIHRLRRRVRRAQARLMAHQTVINSEVEILSLDQHYLPRSIKAIKSGNPLRDTINKYLTIIHYVEHINEVSFQGSLIATRTDNGRDNYIFPDPDFDEIDADIGTLSLLPEITATPEILNAIADLWLFVYNGVSYQREHPLVDVSWTSYDYWAQFRCKPGCWCDDCRSKTARCQACLDDGCEDCDRG